MKRIDPDRTRFVIPPTVLDDTAALLAEPGEEGYEGSVLWIGRVIDETTAEVARAYRPEQIASATAAGRTIVITPTTRYVNVEGGHTADAATAIDDAVLQPLRGVRVVDFSWVLTGPICTKYLAALGAEIGRFRRCFVGSGRS